MNENTDMESTGTYDYTKPGISYDKPGKIHFSKYVLKFKNLNYNE